MAILPGNLDYTDRDFDSLRARLEALIKSVFPDWTDFQVANFGNILIEHFAFVGDVLTKYQDNQSGESRIVTATQRKNILNLAKLIGFTADGNAPATAELTVTLAEVPVGDFTLNVGQEVRTKQVTDPVLFELLTAVTILAAADPPTATVDVENSTSQSEQFQSTSLPNQEFVLAEIPFIDNSLAISAADGIYTEEVNFLSSDATERHFVVVVDQNDRATVKFGNGINGTIPQGTIDMDYKTGGGAIGNVEAGTIEVIEGSFTDDLANPVQVSVTNVLKASGGVDRDSVEKIRQEAPESLRVLNRTVAREDYEINAEKLAQVARSLMLTSDNDTEIAENSGILFIIPEGGGQPTQSLLDAVLTQVTVTFPNTLTFKLEVRGSVFLTVNISARVFRAQGVTQAETRAEIEDVLNARFAISNPDGSKNLDVDYGFNFKDVDGNPSGEISWSVLQADVQNAQTVRKIGDQDGDFTLNGVDDDLTINQREFPQLGTVTLLDGDTGEAF